MVCPIPHRFWIKLRSALLGFKRRHSTGSTWKVMGISLNISRAVKTGLSTLEIPYMDPGLPLNAGTSAGLEFVLLWASNPFTMRPCELPKNGNVCLLLILGQVKCLLKFLSLFIESRNIKSDQVNLWLHCFKLVLERKMLPLVPLQWS